MKNKKGLFTLVSLFSFVGAITIGVIGSVKVKKVSESVSAITSNDLNAPTFLPSNDLQELYNYYIYLPIEDIKLGDYSSLPSIDTLIPNYLQYNYKELTIPFYPSITYNGLHFTELFLMVEYLEGTYRYTLSLFDEDEFVAKFLECYIVVDTSTSPSIKSYKFEVGYFNLDTSSYEMWPFDVFNGTHYVRYVRSSNDLDYAKFFKNFLGCFSVSSARQMSAMLDFNDYNDFPFHAGYQPYYFYDVGNGGISTNIFSDFTGTTTNTVGNVTLTQNRYQLVPLFEGDIFFQGTRYTGVYAVFRSLLDFDGVVDLFGPDHTIVGGGIDYTIRDAVSYGYYGLYSIIIGSRSLDSYFQLTSTSLTYYLEDGVNYSVYNRAAVKWWGSGVYLSISCLNYYYPLMYSFTNPLGIIDYVYFPIDSYNALTSFCSYIYYGLVIYVPNEGNISGDIPATTLVLNSFKLLSNALSGLTGLLTFMVVPGISIGMIIAVPFLITILLFVIKLFKR